MQDWFDYRTKRHIQLVENNLLKISYLNLSDIDNNVLNSEITYHDQSKFKFPEKDPYVYTVWKYRQDELGNSYDIPSDMVDKTREATFHHIRYNRHHPEYWDKSVTIDCLNPMDRDKPGKPTVDGTLMPPSYIAAMVADWLAVSQEKGTSIHKWAEDNVNKRWKFTPKQVNLINALLNFNC